MTLICLLFVLLTLKSQLCGVRGGGNAAAQAAFWQAKAGLSFVLAFESERERNAAIMLARRFAFDCNVSHSYSAKLDYRGLKIIVYSYYFTTSFFPLRRLLLSM